MRRFVQTMQPQPQDRLLDLGGTVFNWEIAGWPCRITLLNLKLLPDAALPASANQRAGDATALPDADNSFDLCFSNSVIEHVGDWQAQQRFASEARRIAPRLWIQTPARSFFFEPHVLAPFVHWLPLGWQRRLLRNATPWGWIVRPDAAEVERVVAGTRLLNARELRTLFPNCELRCERFLLMTKSYIVVRGARR